MKSYALALGLGVSLAALTQGCTAEHDYAVAVPWLLNGFAPDRDLCDRLGIARGRLEVSNRNGGKTKTLEADCAAQVYIIDPTPPAREGYYGGFQTTYAFDWDTTYLFKVSLVDASGSAVSPAYEGEFRVDYDSGEILSLGTFDYLQPVGTVSAVTASWSESTNDLPVACANHQIESVRVVLVTSDNPGFEYPYELARVACADGKWSSNGKILEIGDYFVRYEAHKSDGTPNDAYPKLGEAIPVTVDGTSETITLPNQMFLFN